MIREIVEDCLNLLDAIADQRVDAWLLAETGEPAQEDRRFVDGVMPESQAIDIAALGSFELRQELSILKRTGVEQSPWQIIARLDSALREVLKVATVLHSVCRHEDDDVALTFDTELRNGLQVRAVYSRFRRQIENLKHLDRSEDTKLRSAATCIACLAGRDIYPKMRIRDRLALSQLRERMVTCLRQAQPNAAECRRLGTDLRGFAELLKGINLRQELVEHDRKLIEGVLADDDFDPAQLASLAGLDDGLDSMIETGAPRVEIRPVLWHLLDNLAGRTPHPSQTHKLTNPLTRH